MPDHDSIRSLQNIGILKKILHDPDIFHLTRRSASGGIATGLFIAFLPMPGHTILAIFAAVLLRINLPLTLLLAWTTNPFTVAPIYYIAYRTGAILLGESVRPVNMEIDESWFSTVLSDIWLPLLIGCMIFSIVTAICGYVLVRVLWRYSVISKWKNRKVKQKL
ncbi:MAG: DUF2062 domain-containing protein [Gammaproteobacteria bacterium]|nr:DUF2062 domain-containing protein [Gammaproteobacteria bacterium]